MGSGDLWVKHRHFLWLVVTSHLEFGVGTWVGWGQVSGGGIWRSSSWVSRVSWDSSWLLSGAWSSRLSILWSIGSIASLSDAVDTIWAIGSVAWWKRTRRGLDVDWGPLSEVLDSHLEISAVLSSDTVLTVAGWESLHVVEWLSLHGDVLSEILISSHGVIDEHSKLGVRNARDTSDFGVHTGVKLHKTSSRLVSFVPGSLVEVRVSIRDSDS